MQRTKQADNKSKANPKVATQEGVQNGEIVRKGIAQLARQKLERQRQFTNDVELAKQNIHSYVGKCTGQTNMLLKSMIEKTSEAKILCGIASALVGFETQKGEAVRSVYECLADDYLAEKYQSEARDLTLNCFDIAIELWVEEDYEKPKDQGGISFYKCLLNCCTSVIDENGWGKMADPNHSVW